MGPMGYESRAVFRDIDKPIRGLCLESAMPSSPAL